MSHELTERDENILKVIRCLEFVPEDELEKGVESYKISNDPTVSLPTVLVETGRISGKHMDAIEAVADAKLEAVAKAAPHRVTSADKLDEIAREKDAALQRAAATGAFSARSKDDIKSAWAAYKKKGSAPSEPASETAPKAEESPQEGPPPEVEVKPELQSVPKPTFERVRRTKPEPKMDIPEGKKFVPSWMKKKTGAPDEGGPAEAEAAAGEEQKEEKEKEEDAEKQLHVFVARALRSRLHQQVLEELVMKRITVVDPDDLAKGLEAKERDVRRVLDDWRACGIMKQLGSHPYAFSPGKKDLGMIRTFLKLWTQPSSHSKLLRLILAEESKG